MTPSEEDVDTETAKKPLSFWLSFIALNTTVFLVSLDATALTVAVPVRSNENNLRAPSTSLLMDKVVDRE